MNWKLAPAAAALTLFVSACVAEHPVGIPVELDDASTAESDAGFNAQDAQSQAGTDASTVDAVSASLDAGGGADAVEIADAGAIDASANGAGPYCEVTARVFGPFCTSCHHPGGNTPDLTFDGAKQGVVGATSAQFGGAVIVSAGNPQGSLLYRKITRTQGQSEGMPMPSQVALGAQEVAIVEAWIRGGAPTACDQPDAGFDPDGGSAAPDAGFQRHHPAGFDQAAAHGPALKQQAEDCRTCHGADLRGGSGPSCDSCHAAGWRTNCTYCHGGTDSMTGAPPRDLNGTTQRAQLSFRAHTEHGSNTLHPAYDCVQCHTKPSDVLSSNHIFDSTPGHVEVSFLGGISASGTYGGSGACSTLYCHGNGRTSQGSYNHTQAAPACGSCHPGPSATGIQALRMSGQHGRHIGERIACAECHADTVSSNGMIIGPDRHVNGMKDFRAPGTTITYSGGRCSGNCHGEVHNARRW